MWRLDLKKSAFNQPGDQLGRFLFGIQSKHSNDINTD